MLEIIYFTQDKSERLTLKFPLKMEETSRVEYVKIDVRGSYFSSYLFIYVCIYVFYLLSHKK